MTLSTRHLLAWLLCTAATGAIAHGNVQCPDTTKEERKPQIELERKLIAEGWRVRQVKTTNGCYEVYGFDAKGERMEAFFNPKTFERVQEK